MQGGPWPTDIRFCSEVPRGWTPSQLRMCWRQACDLCSCLQIPGYLRPLIIRIEGQLGRPSPSPGSRPHLGPGLSSARPTPQGLVACYPIINILTILALDKGSGRPSWPGATVPEPRTKGPGLVTTHSLGPGSGGKHCGGEGGCPKVRATAAGAANIQMGWSLACRARRGPSEPGPPLCFGVRGKALGALRAAAAGFPQNGSKTRGLGSRAGSIPDRCHRRKLRYPGPDNCRRNGGDAAPGSWGPGVPGGERARALGAGRG